MQFIKNGPDIPERLLQAHEDGRVILFCGAGISFPARLPGFKSLIKKLYAELSFAPNPVQQTAIKAGQYDTVISLLEGKSGITGGREKVRKVLESILTPNLSASSATATHEALLNLARLRDGRLRLITTNFDRLFEEVISKQNLNIERFEAPLLPVPKNKWDGLVYLHGLLAPPPSSISQLDRLVISSGDFGLAYLTERWAARFVSELFRNYTVCFVGYSINDPILRYMMDALAADQQLGESPPEMFAFGSYSKHQEKKCTNEWLAKNVTPILYREHNHHTYLHKTLIEWADIYRNGVSGKTQIISRHAIYSPLNSTVEDNFAGRVIWAISDKSGLPAKFFAELEQVPPLSWLEWMDKNLLNHNDLSRFKVTPNTLKDDALNFSILRRPSPYTDAPWMKLVNTGNENGKWDDVMTQIAHWLTRHLDDSNLILWVAKHGGQLHPQFARLIRNRLTELHQFIQQNNNAALNHIRTYSPSAIPRPVMRTLWNLVLSGRVSSNAYRSDSLYDWVRHYNSNGLTTTLRLELRDILSSHVRLREPLHWNKADININTSDRLNDLVKWEIALNTEHLHSHYTFNNLQKDAQWVEALPKILPDFNMLLRDILDLKCELNGVNAINDYSYIDQPSISDHPQNNDYNDWTVLIKLTRDAWLTLSKINPDQALLVAEEWYQTPYPIFKRLAFFAATQRNVISTERALKWLLADDAWWLWSPEVLRETIRLLVSLTPELNLTDLSQLEITILKGPPPKMYKEDIEDERWSKVMERAIWLRLSKIKAAGIILSPNSTAELDLISQRNMQWKLLHDDRDEFPFWLDSGDGVEPWCTILDTPTRRIDLVPWLKKHPNTNSSLQDQWEKRCNEKFSTTFCALLALTLEDEWPSDRWREALQGWVSHKQIKRTWHYLGPLLDRAPDDVIQSCARSISWWLLSLSKNFDGSNDLFLKLINRILIINYEDDFSTDNSVNQAINHPIGLVTDALLNWWYRQSPLDNQGLPDNIKQVFTEMCNTKIIKFRYSRVYLATHAVSLFRVDEQWATENLLPLFDWQVSEFEARIAWESFLYTPRLHRSFLSAIKQPILETVKHYEELGDLAHQYADFLTFAALDFKDVFSISELALATRSLPNDGIASIALALARAFEGSGDQHHEYWQNRVLPYLKSIWPKSREFISPQISQALAKICIEAEEDFPEAFSEIKHWLVPIEWPDFLFRKLSKSILPKQYPKATLVFIDKLIDGNTRWYSSSYLNTCLEDAIAISPDLENDPMYRQLSEYVEKYL